MKLYPEPHLTNACSGRPAARPAAELQPCSGDASRHPNGPAAVAPWFARLWGD